MKYQTIFFAFFMTLTICYYTSAQDTDSTEASKTESEDWFDYDFQWDKDGFQLNGSPTIALMYGSSNVQHNDFNTAFTNSNFVELQLGYTDVRPSKYSEKILGYKFNYTFLSNHFSKNENSDAKIAVDMWRFGFGWATGYGYDLGESSIIPYHSTSISWSRVKFKNSIADSNDANISARFNESFRFGSAAEAGIRVQIVPLISVDVAYERSIIFERHLFWKWAGSGIIEAASQGMLDHFIKKIGKSSPMALPIVNFVLKSALSYGIYELRQEKMNWPFSSAAPLSFDQWKVGVTFNF